MRSGDKKAAPSEGAAGGEMRPHKCDAVHDWRHLLLSCEIYKMPRAAKRDEGLRESHN